METCSFCRKQPVGLRLLVADRAVICEACASSFANTAAIARAERPHWTANIGAPIELPPGYSFTPSLTEARVREIAREELAAQQERDADAASKFLEDFYRRVGPPLNREGSPA